MKEMKIKILNIAVFLFVSLYVFPSDTYYVSPSGSNTPPYNSLATAANNIQDAIDLASVNDIVLVDDGTYTLSSNISINKGITVQSINGNTAVVIDGNNSTRCVYINNSDAILDGFTVKNGYNPGSFGGGIDIENGGTVQNCIVEYNQARDGGGVAIDNSGYLLNSIIRYNDADNNSGNGYGGGVRLLNGGEIRNCLVYSNTSQKYGGGVNIWNAGNVYNTTITDNTAPNGAGIRTRNNSLIKNTIIYFNNGDNWEVNGSGYKYYNCTTTPALGSSYSSNCITDDPLFVDASSDNYHIQTTSALRDAGYNMSWMSGTYDLDGNDRKIDGTVDIGCYELPTSAPTDTDGDGIADVDDDFPNDPNAAFINYFPASGKGSLAYEDLWPGKGDYDFNDIVVDYRFASVTNAGNKVYYITATFEVKASGAYLKNGFGFELPDADDGLITDVAVSGYDLQEGIITLNANGTESGQSHPVFILFDDVFNILEHAGTAIGVNTEESAPFVPYETMVLTLTPTANTWEANDFSVETWNPFIFVNHVRSHEIHLPDHAPSDLADNSIFGTWEDDSDPQSGRYYKTVTNLPWAINIVSEFDWPIEKEPINNVYNYFIDWAVSGGASNTDWYEDTPGYRNEDLIYTP
jgi:LruC domain-containing protein